MKLARTLHPSLIAIAALFAAVVQTGCNQDTAQQQGLTILAEAASYLSVSPSVATIEVSNSYTFNATNGLSPYTYSVLSGPGVIDASSGLYTAGSIPGVTQIIVKDSLGFETAASVTVVTSLTDSEPNATYSWVGGGFGSCSASCGPAVKTQTVSCQDNKGNVVNTALCSGPAPSTVSFCSQAACSGQWAYSGLTGINPNNIPCVVPGVNLSTIGTCNAANVIGQSCSTPGISCMIPCETASIGLFYMTFQCNQ